VPRLQLPPESETAKVVALELGVSVDALERSRGQALSRSGLDHAWTASARATLEWVDRFNPRRQLERISHVPAGWKCTRFVNATKRPCLPGSTETGSRRPGLRQTARHSPRGTPFTCYPAMPRPCLRRAHSWTSAGPVAFNPERDSIVAEAGNRVLKKGKAA
jgi:hypothetical protein